ncbi:hypothetical protein BLNAU_4013 [Blattamonas nauphoetae]|uniref:VPS9 domain-containing protein n=1 Tax=Blattamonas nauphoetae TaxID=2049346 RepID=A0ABQ9YAX1_9EUKA|nr:hypothetical protein BLNAU_4013 [Blattamonas nauphoetae]
MKKLGNRFSSTSLDKSPRPQSSPGNDLKKTISLSKELLPSVNQPPGVSHPVSPEFLQSYCSVLKDEYRACIQKADKFVEDGISMYRLIPKKIRAIRIYHSREAVVFCRRAFQLDILFFTLSQQLNESIKHLLFSLLDDLNGKLFADDISSITESQCVGPIVLIRNDPILSKCLGVLQAIDQRRAKISELLSHYLTDPHSATKPIIFPNTDKTNSVICQLQVPLFSVTQKLEIYRRNLFEKARYLIEISDTYPCGYFIPKPIENIGQVLLFDDRFDVGQMISQFERKEKLDILESILGPDESFTEAERKKLQKSLSSPPSDQTDRYVWFIAKISSTLCKQFAVPAEETEIVHLFALSVVLPHIFDGVKQAEAVGKRRLAERQALLQQSDPLASTINSTQPIESPQATVRSTEPSSSPTKKQTKTKTPTELAVEAAEKDKEYAQRKMWTRLVTMTEYGVDNSFIPPPTTPAQNHSSISFEQAVHAFNTLPLLESPTDLYSCLCEACDSVIKIAGHYHSRNRKENRIVSDEKNQTNSLIPLNELTSLQQKKDIVDSKTSPDLLSQSPDPSSSLTSHLTVGSSEQPEPASLAEVETAKLQRWIDGESDSESDHVTFHQISLHRDSPTPSTPNIPSLDSPSASFINPHVPKTPQTLVVEEEDLSAVSADVFIPILIFVLSRSSLFDPHTIIHIIRCFIPKSRIRGQAEYFLLSFTAAVQFLTQCVPDDIARHLEPAENGGTRELFLQRIQP